MQFKKCLESISSQSLPTERFEVICVDDSGPEQYETQENLLRNLDISYSLRYYQTGLPEETYGKAVAHNIAVRKARSTIISFTHDSCVLHPEFLKVHLEQQKQKNKHILVGYISQDRDILSKEIPIKAQREKYQNLRRRCENGECNEKDIPGKNFSVRREHIEDAGYFNEHLARPDVHGYTIEEMGMRLLALGCEIRCTPDAAVWKADSSEAQNKGEYMKLRENGYEMFQRIQRSFRNKLRLYWCFGWMGLCDHPLPQTGITPLSDRSLNQLERNQLTSLEL